MRVSADVIAELIEKVFCSGKCGPGGKCGA